MITWNSFSLFGSVSAFLWLAGAAFSFKESWKKTSILLSAGGLLIFLSFIVGLWISLERPPMRTMGETRLLYSFFVAGVALSIFIKWRYKWILLLGMVLASVFVVINILKPELHDKVLMPVLQSAWFVPHVVVYMLAYSILACSTLLAIYGYVKKDNTSMVSTDNLVYIASAFLLMGMLFGAIWAKQAWGHYWDWDPKEIWAAITWFTCLAYIHTRQLYPSKRKIPTALLFLAFSFMQICWYGIKYLPSASQSMHIYSN